MVEYEDGLGRKYSAKEDFFVSMKNISFFQRIVIMLNRIGEIFS